MGRAQPIDPSRRQPRPAGGPGTEGAPPASGPSGPGTDVEEQPARRLPASRPPAGRPPSRRGRAAGARSALDRVRGADFPVVLRGYDRAAVDAYVAEVAQLVAELEATQLPETVVQRALDEVGEETSAILKRAHEAGEEITTRSRSQAEDRLRRAEREAELTRKEAEEQVRRLEDDVQSIWQERHRLIEDIRTLADDVLALADDAIDRMPGPGDGGDEGGEGVAPVRDSTEEAARESERPHPIGGPVGVSRRDEAGEGPGQQAEAPDEPAEAPDEPGTGPREDGPADETLTLRQPPEDEDTAERPPGGQGS